MSSGEQSQPAFPPADYRRGQAIPAEPRQPASGAPLLPTTGFRPPPQPGYGRATAGQPYVGQPYGQVGAQLYGQAPAQLYGYPAAAVPHAVAAAGPPAPSPISGPSGPPPRPPTRSAIAAVLLALSLVAMVGWQAYQLHQLSGRLRDVDRRLDQAQAADAARADRIGQLEQQAGKAFNPEAISAAVLPSVFRVNAGDVTGTAFAVGRPSAGGGTNLFTNWHVVESVWERGDRKVFLERRSQRFPATIVKVDKDKDVAQLTTDARFTGLKTALTPVRSGQPIVVVGAPLGLEDSVTTGVVSAQRTVPDLAGPMIQFDAPINPGNSGGPVVNGAKQVVGIATAKQRDAEGIGLAIPITTACNQIKIC